MNRYVLNLGLNFMAKQRVLVTGGAGYIGSHTCKLLATEGYDPIVVDNLSTGNKWAVKLGPLEICDIRDIDAEYQESGPVS